MNKRGRSGKGRVRARKDASASWTLDGPSTRPTLSCIQVEALLLLAENYI